MKLQAIGMSLYISVFLLAIHCTLPAAEPIQNNFESNSNFSSRIAQTHLTLQVGPSPLSKGLKKPRKNLGIETSQGNSFTFSQDGDVAAMMDAVRANDIPEIKGYLAIGGNVNVIDSNGDTMLIHAARYGRAEIARILINHGADVNAKNEDGYTALYHASYRAYIDIVKALLEKVEDVNVKTDRGDTPLISTAVNGEAGDGRLEIVQMLLARGADVNAKNNYGRTALMPAYDKPGQTSMFATLLNAGAKVNERDGRGWTPLMYYICEGCASKVRALIAKGADVNIEANDGTSALSLAKLSKLDDIAEILEVAGARIRTDGRARRGIPMKDVDELRLFLFFMGQLGVK